MKSIYKIDEFVKLLSENINSYVAFDTLNIYYSEKFDEKSSIFIKMYKCYIYIGCLSKNSGTLFDYSTYSLNIIERRNYNESNTIFNTFISINKENFTKLIYDLKLEMDGVNVRMKKIKKKKIPIYKTEKFLEIVYTNLNINKDDIMLVVLEDSLFLTIVGKHEGKFINLHDFNAFSTSSECILDFSYIEIDDMNLNSLLLEIKKVYMEINIE